MRSHLLYLCMLVYCALIVAWICYAAAIET
jgi:hypothetical protein